MLAPGSRLAHFSIQRQLGAGGMGVVYEAIDETLGRKVAIKVLPPELVGSAERRQRFLREARSAAAMSHPNIATVFEIDEVDGQVFIVMELVAGESLRDLMAKGRLSISRALDIALGVTRAAGHAHAAGVVHRDLKPENVMVLQEDQVKVLDFGVAKPDVDAAFSSMQPHGAAITEQGRVLGTPGYMAPEQARGEHVDARTDVFSIGVVLYEMVTGARPFQGGSSVDVIVATTRDDPPPVASHNPGAPRVIETIVRRCLAKDPAARFSSAHELEDALDAAAREVSAHELATTQAMPTPFPSTPPRPAASPTTTAATALPAASVEPRRRPVLALVLVTLVFAGLGFGASKALRGKRERSAHARALVSATEVEPALPRLGLETLDRYGKESLSSSSLSPGEWETAALDFERALATHRGAPVRWSSARLLALGMRDLAHGKLEASSEALRNAARVDATFALPHVGLSSLLVRQGKFDDAILEAQTAQTLAPDLVVTVAAAGRAYSAAGRPTDAIEQFRRALEKSPVPGLRAQLALAYHHANYDEAAVREAEQVLKEDPDNVMAHVLLAERALEKSDGKTAVSHSERAVAVEPRNSTAWLAHGDALLLSKREREAKAALSEAVRLWIETKQVGAPAARLEIVKAALAADKLPAPRVGGRASPAPAAGRSLPAPTSAPQRSKPSKAAGF